MPVSPQIREKHDYLSLSYHLTSICFAAKQQANDQFASSNECHFTKSCVLRDEQAVSLICSESEMNLLRYTIYRDATGDSEKETTLEMLIRPLHCASPWRNCIRMNKCLWTFLVPKRFQIARKVRAKLTLQP